MFLNSFIKILIPSSTPCCPLYWKESAIAQEMKFSTHRKTPDWNPPHETKVGSQRNRFENVGSSPDASVKRYWDFAFCHGGTFPQRVKRCWNAVKLPSTVVGNHNTVKAVSDCKYHIIGRSNFQEISLASQSGM